jgi:hypothetical protein
MSGRVGVERFPQAGEITVEEAVTRSLRALDRTITLEWVQAVTGLFEAHEILRARTKTVLAHPADVRAYFKSQFRSIIPSHSVTPTAVTVPVRSAPFDDPYGD